jgi:hypothetical protein
MGDFTNRIKFDGYIQFAKIRQWQELHLKVSTREGMVILNSVATNQTVNLKIASQGALMEHDIPFSDFQKPDALARTLLGHFADALLNLVDLPDFSDLSASAAPEWTARRTRVKIGRETMPVYRLQSEFLGRTVTVDVSTLGEVLRVELPGNFTARIDEWKRP